MLRSLVAKLKLSLALAAQTVTADVNTAGVDVEAHGSLSLLVNSGAFTYTGVNKIALVVEHSDDNSTFAACVAADIYSPEDGANGIAKILDDVTDGAAVHPIHYLGNKRYVRLKLDVSGTVSAAISVSAIQGHSEMEPSL